MAEADADGTQNKTRSWTPDDVDLEYVMAIPIDV